MTREEIAEGLRPLLELPVEHVLATHGVVRPGRPRAGVVCLLDGSHLPGVIYPVRWATHRHRERADDEQDADAREAGSVVGFPVHGGGDAHRDDGARRRG